VDDSTMNVDVESSMRTSKDEDTMESFNTRTEERFAEAEVS